MHYISLHGLGRAWQLFAISHERCCAKAAATRQVLHALYTQVACGLRKTPPVAGVPPVGRLWLANPPVASRHPHLSEPNSQWRF